jgi:peptide/nickel transport system ATP-binding protein
MGTGAGTPLLEISGLRVAFAGTEVVHGVDLRVAAGERVAVVGGSGSGKSTTALAVLGLLPGGGRITGGRILLRGEDVSQAGEARLRRLRGREVGLVPQDPMSNLNPVLRVGRQVAETLVVHGKASRRDAPARAVEILALVGLPEPERQARQYPHEFSGGMRQRVLIAIALACRPELLIADEPTSALDVTVQRQILDRLDSLTGELGTAMLLVTHDLGLAAERADRVVVLADGRVVETGPTREVLTAPRHEYTRRLVAAAPSIVSSVGTGVGPGPEAVARVGPPPVLALCGVSKEYRGRGRGGPLRVVDDVSFEVSRGRTTSVVGESGSGKTTVARVVLGLVPVSSGTIRLDGDDIVGMRGPRLRAARRAMQPVFQDPYGSLDPTFSVERLVGEPLRIFGVGDRVARAARVRELLDQVALPSATARRFPNELSGGQRQRVAIARALALDPALVVCDEAVSALDVLVQDQILRLLRTLQEQLGVSYLFISHDLAVVREISHDVVVMQRGKVVEQGPVDQVLESPTTPYTRELLAAVPGASLPA